MKNARKHHLITQYDNKKKNPAVHLLLKKIIALAYLPATKIEEGLKVVEESAYELGKEQKTTAHWKSFFFYYRREWMTTVKPPNFSVFNAPERTNNALERYHKVLNQLMGHKPSPTKFIGKKIAFQLIYTFNNP